MKISKETIKNIKFGVIVSIIVLIIQTVFRILWEKVLPLGSVLQKNLNNQFYQRVALRDYGLERNIYMYSFYLLTLFFFCVLYFLRVRTSRILEGIKEKEKNLLDEGKENNKKKSISDLKKEKDEKIEQLREYRDNVKNDASWLAILTIIMFIYFTVSGFFNFSTEWNIKQKISIYENAKRIIAPYITELEEKTYESKFVLIKNEEDYDNLILEMNEIIIKNGLEVKWEKK